MSKMEDYTIIRSKLSGLLTQEDVTIEVCIYRGDAERTWILEVVDEEGTSTVWPEGFLTEQAAMEELKRTIEKEGMGMFVSGSGEPKH